MFAGAAGSFAVLDVLSIFLTGPLGHDLRDFEHGDLRLVFDRIDSAGPRRLAEGPVRIFIDWVMDDLSGLEMCRRLRADPRTGTAHITMVLEQDDGEDRRRALEAGADDYLLGPLDREIVLDRILASHPGGHSRHATQVVRQGALEIDLLAQQARWAETAIMLRPNELRLLRFFAENPDRVLTRTELIAGLGKSEPPLDDRTVDVWIGRLRRALKCAGAGNPLRTVRAIGYVFDTR